jgi:hypothetical protein
MSTNKDHAAATPAFWTGRDFVFRYMISKTYMEWTHATDSTTTVAYRSFTAQRLEIILPTFLIHVGVIARVI